MPRIKSRPMIFTDDIRKMSVKELHSLAGKFSEYKAELESQITKHEARLKEVNRKLRQEIAERKQVEEKLMKNEKYFRTLVENALDIILVTDADGSIRYGSPATRNLLGYDPQEVIGTSIFYFVHPDNMADALKMFREFLQNPSYITHVEYRLKHNDGLWRNAEIVGQNALTNPAVTGFILNIRDITERKLAEEALHETSEFNSSILENSPNPIMVYNPDTSIRYINPAFEQLTGFLHDELIGKRAPYPWWPKNNIPEIRKQLRTVFQKNIHGLESCFQRKNGDTFWVEINTMLVKSQGELKYLLSSWTDITEQKNLRDELDYYTHEITKAQEEEKRRIARELHDDTAQSLAMLSLEIDSVIDAGENLPEKVKSTLKQLRAGVNRTMQDVRRFSHELRPGVLDQLGLLAALESLVDDLNEKGQIEVNIQVTGSERRLSNDVELALFRLAQETMNNIRKHSQATKATIRIRFLPKKVRLVIADNGKGFDLRKVHDFAKAGKLGLIGMKERAHLIGADLKIKSKLNLGTAVSIELII